MSVAFLDRKYHLSVAVRSIIKNYKLVFFREFLVFTVAVRFCSKDCKLGFIHGSSVLGSLNVLRITIHQSLYVLIKCI